MSGTSLSTRGWRHFRTAVIALMAVALTVGAVRAQQPATPDALSPAAAALLDPNVTQAGCAACAAAGGGYDKIPGCNDCSAGCGGNRCVPGRMECCEPCDSCSMFGRFWCGVKGAFCCPDPCYQPCYIPAANAGIFVDGAKPVSQTSFRFDDAVGGSTMDRGEYYFGRFGTKGPPLARFRRSGIDYRELTQTAEYAIDRFSIFTNTPYRSVSYSGGGLDGGGYGAGFSDLMIGTKSLMIDSEILLLGSEFKTYIPIANFRKGLGNGHVSLEPSLLATLKVMADTYIQFQLSEWIPIAGTPGFDGAMIHYHASLNHVLMKPTNDLQLIGTMEFFGYRFQDGLYTVNAAGATASAHDDSYFSVGPGVRLVFCTKFDIGFGTGFSVTSNNFARQLYRTEVRWRF